MSWYLPLPIAANLTLEEVDVLTATATAVVSQLLQGADDIFDDDVVSQRSLTLDVIYFHTPPPIVKKEKTGGMFSRKTVTTTMPAEPELRKWRIITFAKQPRVTFFLPRVWMHVKGRRATSFGSTLRMQLGLDRYKIKRKGKTRMKGAILAAKLIAPDASMESILSGENSQVR